MVDEEPTVPSVPVPRVVRRLHPRVRCPPYRDVVLAHGEGPPFPNPGASPAKRRRHRGQRRDLDRPLLPRRAGYLRGVLMAGGRIDRLTPTVWGIFSLGGFVIA